MVWGRGMEGWYLNAHYEYFSYIYQKSLKHQISLSKYFIFICLYQYSFAASMSPRRRRQQYPPQIYFSEKKAPWSIIKPGNWSKRYKICTVKVQNPEDLGSDKAQTLVSLNTKVQIIFILCNEKSMVTHLNFIFLYYLS